MTYPEGIITRPVEAGSALAVTDGRALTVETVTVASRALIHLATGTRLEKVTSAKASPLKGESLYWVTACTDRSGEYLDADTREIIILGEDEHTHTYTTTLRVFDEDGDVLGTYEIGPYPVPTPETPFAYLDLDSLQVVDVTTGTAIPIPESWTQIVADAEAATEQLAPALTDIADLKTKTTTGYLAPAKVAPLVSGKLPEANVPDRLTETALSATTVEVTAAAMQDDESDLAIATEARIAASGGATGLDTIVTATLGPGSTYALDPTAGDQFILNLTGDATLTIPSYAVGNRFLVQVNQDATGGHTLTLPAAAGPAITLDETANTYELLVYRCWTPGRLDLSHPTVAGPIELPFGPDSVLNGILWLDAENIAGDAGSAVTSWPNSFTSSTIPTTGAGGIPSLQLDDGINVVDFDIATSEYFSSGTIASIPQPITVVALVKTDATSASRQGIFAGGTTGAPMLYVDTSASGSQFKIHAGTALSSAVVDDHSWTIVAAVFNGASSSISIDGGTPVTGNAGTGTQTSIRIGRETGTGYLDGKIAMLVLIGHASNAEEIGNIVELMQARRALLETT